MVTRKQYKNEHGTNVTTSAAFSNYIRFFLVNIMYIYFSYINEVYISENKQFIVIV